MNHKLNIYEGINISIRVTLMLPYKGAGLKRKNLTKKNVKMMILT